MWLAEVVLPDTERTRFASLTLIHPQSSLFSPSLELYKQLNTNSSAIALRSNCGPSKRSDNLTAMLLMPRLPQPIQAV